MQVELGGISHEASPKQASNKAKEHLKKSHYDAWMKKPQHSFLFKSWEKLKDMDNNLTSQWLTKSNITSHVEGYMCAIQEEEKNTRDVTEKTKQGKREQCGTAKMSCLPSRKLINPTSTRMLPTPKNHNVPHSATQCCCQGDIPHVNETNSETNR